MNVLAIFQNDPWKFTDMRALTVISRVRSCKMKKKFNKIFCVDYEKNPEFILINIFSPTFVQNLMTLAWKLSPGMPKEASSLNGPLCAYLISRTSIIELVQDLRAINVLATFQNDPWKFTDVRALTVIFLMRSWKMKKKNRQNDFCRLWKKNWIYIDYHI